jgi:DNA-binding transcriptional ArsR family regulator
MQSGRRGRRSGKRLERLICSGLVSPKDQEEYAAELKKLAAGLGNPDLIERRARLLKALADGTRLKMLGLLSVREMCVCELTVALDLTQPTASHHLNILKNVGLITDRKEGKWIFYKVAKPDVIRGLFSSLGFPS